MQDGGSLVTKGSAWTLCHQWGAASRTESLGEGNVPIRNPVEWGVDHIRPTRPAGEPAPLAVRTARSSPPQVRKIKAAELRDVLVRGFDDFGANRADVIFLCVLYPAIGLVLARLASGNEMLPLLFPLASGFVLVGPLAAVGLYEMSRRRELGAGVTWAAAFGVVRSPALGSIVMLGLLLVATYATWLLAAYAIYMATLGPAPPASIAAFVHDVFTTGPGWTMIGVGMGAGFLFAALVLAISAVSFPMLLDRNVGVAEAVGTSIRAVRANPGPMAIWGLIVAGGLLAGSAPLFVGLIVVLPVLGHATWHLYRKMVPHE